MKNCNTVLFVSLGPDLTNPASGAGTRLKYLSRELADQGWRVLALVPSDASNSYPDWVAKRYTYNQWSLPLLTDVNPSFVRSLDHVLSSEAIDVIHLSAGVCAAKALTVLRSETAVVYASQNVEADHAQDFVNPDLPVFKRFLGPRLIPLIEWGAVHCADGITTVSEKDQQRFIERYGVDKADVTAVPTGTKAVNHSELEPPADVRDRLGLGDGSLAVFHGYYEHPPNREAAELIDQQIAPAMREREVDVEFVLVGQNPPDVSSPNVQAVGFVDDLLSVLNAADVAVVPILHGGGTKTKLYDYVSLSLPIVATKKAVEGIDLESKRHGLITSDVDEEFVSSLMTLIQNKDLYQQTKGNLADLARKWSWERSVARCSTAYHDLNNP
ncbi:MULTISPECIES: glycosyltransferase family 4 protein [Salinibaculum]|uniref:glycosyltransferase family 4 protein n=1 Tax=Salinibaculum TaxID=2732368 RepID=UPI0030D299DD